MKLRNLIFMGLTAAAAYKYYQNRQQIHQKVTEVSALLTQSQDTLATVKEEVQTLQNQVPELTKFSNHLTYKLRVFQEESQPHLMAIQKTLTKYQNPDRYWK